MKLIKILWASAFLLFKKSVSCEENFEVKIFKSITMVRSDGRIPYLEKYPNANSDQFTEEKRLQLCRAGFDRVLEHEKGKHFQFIGKGKFDKLAVYVLVNPSPSKFRSRDHVEVRTAYECSTAPPIYIHVNLDHYKGDTPSFWVIFKDIGLPLNLNHINEYILQFADEIREVNAEEILATSSVQHTADDIDELEEKERLQMCEKVMNMAPEMGAYILNDTRSGMNKYYGVIDVQESEPEIDTWQDTKKGNETKETWSSEVETDISTIFDIIQAFACPTVPTIHIHVLPLNEDVRVLWAIVKKDKIEEPPAFNIMGYKLTVANSIHKILEKKENKDEQSKLSSPKNVTELTQSSYLSNFPEKQNEVQYLLRRLESTSRHLKTFINKQDAVIEIDELTETDRRFMCVKAIKTVLGGNVKFTEGSTGRSQYYRIYKDQKDGSFIKKEKFLHYELINAISCPTEPVAYLRLVKNLSTNVGQVIVSGRDLALSLMQFK